MKKIYITSMLLTIFSLTVFSQEVVKLPAPDKNQNFSLIDAIQNRRSMREFNPDKMISSEDLSLILWGACGISDEKRQLLTIPTATNAQDIYVYVCTADGVSLYDAKSNTLTKVVKDDIREYLADRQQSVKNAPVFLLLVSNQTKFRANAEHWGAMDAGYASQNISLLCTALGLKTVPRGVMNHEAVKKILNLDENQVLELNHPIGY